MNNVLYFPIKILLVFLVFTEVLFFVGVIDWKISNHVELIFYFFLLNVALLWGYRSGLHVKIRHSIFILSTRTIRFLVWFSFIFVLYSFVADVDFSIQGVYKRLLQLNDIGAGYYDNAAKKLNVPRYIILQLLSPLSFVGNVLGVLKWNVLNKKTKFIYITTILITILYWTSIGTRKGLFDLMILLSASYLLKNPKIIYGKKMKRKAVLVILFSLIAFLSFFLVSNLARYSQYDSFIEMLQHTETPIKSSYATVIPRWAIMPWISIESYLTQGYFALSKALEEGLVSPNIWATNIFTVNLAERIYSEPLRGTYMDILSQKYGIDAYGNWHSIYVWLANGFTLIGTPVVVYIIGFLFSNSWKRSILYREDVISTSLFVALSLSIFYFFANNQMFSFSFVVITGLILAYVLNIGKKNA